MWNLLKVKSNIILLAVDTSRQSVQTYAMILVKEEIRIVCYFVWFSGHEIAISNCKKVSGILNMRDRCNTKYFTAAITIWRLDTRNVNASEIRNYLCPHFQRLVIVTWEDCQLDTRMEFKMGYSRLSCIFCLAIP